MRAGLHTSAGTIQWVVSGYALAFGLTLVAGGRLGDAYGRRRLMLVGLALFIASSAAVGLAPSAGLVVLARLAQGASAGLLTPQNSGLIQQLFRGRERGSCLRGLRADGLGLLGDRAGARRPDHRAGRRGERLAVALPGQHPDRAGRDGRRGRDGAAADSPAPSRPTTGSTYPVRCCSARRCSACSTRSSGSRAATGCRWCCSSASPLFGWAFVAWERRTARRGHPPLLDLALLRSLPGYVNGLAVGALYFTGFTGVLLVTSLYLQEGLGMSPLQAGLLMMPFAAGSAISAPLSGRVVSDLGRRVTVAALATMIDRRRAGRPAGARARPGLAVAGADAAAGRSRRRCGRLPEHDAHALRGAAADGRRGRRRPADRASASAPRSAPPCWSPSTRSCVEDLRRRRAARRAAHRRSAGLPRVGDGRPRRCGSRLEHDLPRRARHDAPASRRCTTTTSSPTAM